MQASVKIMDIDVDMMSNDVFIRKMNEYLTDDHLDVIMFASTKMLNKAMEDEEYRAFLEKADLFLPGEKALLATHHADVLEAGNMVVYHSRQSERRRKAAALLQKNAAGAAGGRLLFL